MDLTVNNPIKFNIVPVPNSIFTCIFKLKGTTEKAKVDIGIYIYHRTIPSSTDILSVIESVFTDINDKIYTVNLAVPNFDPQKRADSYLTVALHPPLSFNTKIQIEDINFEKPGINAVLNIPKPNTNTIISNIFNANSRLNIICEGLMLGHSGFAKAMRNVTYNLDKLGCNVKSLILDSDNIKSSQTPTGTRILQLSRGTSVITSNENKFWITMNYPLGIAKHAGYYSIAYVMFETVNFPANFVNHLKATSNEIWTPSNFCKESMIRGGLTNVHTMPLGVDTELFNPNRIKGDASHIVGNMIFPQPNKFKFLSVMGFSERKGVSILVRAFSEEFQNNPNVMLYIKGGWYDLNKATNEINKARAGILNPPLIHLDFNLYSDEVLANLYKLCDVFVLPSRGEGWCLPCIEAMSMELPTIATKFGGQLQFMDDTNSFLINVEGYAPEPRCYWITQEYINQKFAIPSKDHLKQLMRHVYNNKEDAKLKAKNAREHIVKNFDWSISCARMKNRLEQICVEQ